MICCESQIYDTVEASYDETFIVEICWGDILDAEETVETVNWESSGSVEIFTIKSIVPGLPVTEAVVQYTKPGDKVAATVTTSYGQVDRRVILFVQGH